MLNSIPHMDMSHLFIHIQLTNMWNAVLTITIKLQCRVASGFPWTEALLGGIYQEKIVESYAKGHVLVYVNTKT